MGEEKKPEIGSIAWRDLTVPDAVKVRDFYCEVVGWRWQDHDMGEYSDFDIRTPDSGTTVAGICHARGPNADIPPQWLLYLNVADIEHSARRCVDLGGEIKVPIRDMGGGRMCVIQDPAGAVAALWQSA